MRVVCIVIVNLLVHVIEGVKPKSVNLALETVLRFDKDNHNADVEVINKVQKFLDTVKNVMTDYNGYGGRRSNTGANSLKLTDFIRESARILKTYDDNDLEDVFVVLDNELRKYHYKGCKFYELVENHDVRRFMSNKLEQVKGTPATKLRTYLDKVITTIDKDDFKGKDRFIVNLLNSLYSGTGEMFRSTIHDLKTYRAKGSGAMLTNFIAGTLRILLFDHYSNLNNNARSQVKTVIQNYWTSSDKQKDVEDGDTIPSTLKVIEVNKYFNNGMREWSKDVMNNLYPTRSPISYKELQKYKAQSKLNTKVGQKRFKVTGATEKTTLKTNSKSSERNYIATDDDNAKRHKGHKKRKNKDKMKKDHKRVKIIPTPKTVSMEYETFLSKKEVKKLSENTDHSKIHYKKKHKKVRLSTPKEILDETNSDSFELTIPNIKHVRHDHDKVKLDQVRSEYTRGTTISKSIENKPSEDKFKSDEVKIKNKVSISNIKNGVTNYYGDAVKSGEGFLTYDSNNLGDLEKDGQSIENSLSIEKRIKEKVDMDPNSIGVLTGGQNIENMHYRAATFKKINRKPRHEKKKKSEVLEKPQEILTEHSAVIDVQLPIQNWMPETPSIKKKHKTVRTPIKQIKSRQHHRQHKSKKTTRKPKDVKIVTTEAIDARKSFTAIEKHASDEGMTIESFETNEVYGMPKKKAHPNHHHKKEINNETNMKMESLFNKLEVQIKNVQKQIELLQSNEAKQRVKDKSHASFRAAEDSIEETRTTTTTTDSITATTKLLKLTTDLETTKPFTVNITRATSVEAENYEVPTSTTSLTTTTSTTSIIEPTMIFRSQDNVETSINSNVTIEKTVDSTKVDKEIPPTTTSHNLTETINSSVTPTVINTTDNSSTTENPDSLSSKKIMKNDPLLDRGNLLHNSGNETKAPKLTTPKEKKGIKILNELRERIKAARSSSELNELDFKLPTDPLGGIHDSKDNSNTTNKPLIDHLNQINNATNNLQPSKPLDDPLEGLDNDFNV